MPPSSPPSAALNVLAPGVRYIDLHFRGAPHVIATAVLEGRGRVALVDPGPASTLPALRAGLARGGLSLADVDCILLTHIHLDHAGATGTIVAEHPRVQVCVHERGAPHLLDPTKLLKSATRLYGDEMDALWGPFLPVPASRVTALAGGETVEAGGRPLAVAYTPGHASHHLAWFDRESGIAFVGDVAGLRVPEHHFVLPPTPPPDIDLEAWEASVERVLAWHPHGLFLTHFGLVSTPAPHLQELLSRLRRYAEIARASLASSDDPDAQRDRFIAGVQHDLRSAVGDAAATRYTLAAPLDQCWQGLARYWKKRASQ
jgi:glyoxylase-like metal-dependent hydrolase (beta-lactamase superfamily II)